MSKQTSSYLDRQQITRSYDIGDSTKLSELVRVCNNNPTATIELDWYYEDCNVMLVWYEPETDQEMNDRIARYESALQREKAKKEEKDKKTLAAEKREYLRLKKKFEKK